MKKNTLNLSLFLSIFLFLIFAFSNVGFLFGLAINPLYIFLALFVALSFIYKSKNNIKYIFIVCFVFLISIIFSNIFIDTSFDGRCYHFTIENLLKLGFNPIWGDIENFAHQNDIYYNLLFAKSYPNLIEVLRANFYLLFNNMESSKIVNFLFVFLGFFYSTYFFLNKLDKLKAILLSLCVFSCAVVISQIHSKMIDFALYYLFVLQVFSIILIENKKDIKNNSLILIMTSVMSVAIKYVGLLNCIVVLGGYFIYKIINKHNLKFFKKTMIVILISTFVLCLQPYFTNLIKFKNPFYPSIGFNKLDFMTGQNPKEFQGKSVAYKFFRSMFSSMSDARLNNPLTPKLYWKAPFTSHFDMPYVTEEVRISGFGHLFSGIFILNILILVFLIFKLDSRNKKEFVFVQALIFLSVFLNPICWWARFVPQLHLFIVLNIYYLFKTKNKLNEIMAFLVAILLIYNGYWVMKENYSTSAYKTYVMHNFYNDLYNKSQNNKLLLYVDKTPKDEDDTTIIPRLREYGVDFNIIYKEDKSFKPIETDCTITKSYKIKY